MFRYRPPVFALACVALWLLQLLFLPMALGWFAGERFGQWVVLGATVLLGALLLVQLPRVLRWRPRRSARPSPELQAERQRIAQTLHDSVGSQLVGAMALLDAAQPAQQHALHSLEQCLLELRVVVDSMDSTDEALPDRLARLRHRFQPVLEHRGIAMDWSVQEAGSGAVLGGAAAQQLALIVQEALSNTLQHAHATRVSVSWGPASSGNAWLLQVSDNGRGLARADGAAPPGGGKGLAGMRSRAQQAGGRLQVGPSAQGGVWIGVEVPCVAALPGAAGPGALPGRRKKWLDRHLFSAK
ncbi:hypothetical protein B2J86_01560 [Acidovorax sp. SRB_14]|uniref:sensor histidine kinase n=1 Tax=Acidovorax sp. SRB_14 TaxID=1962699 RepID=UPI00146B0A7E|nr:ATP-binding protein [Acidovorax sp. SRB_14]NMM79629.1 hypothetical protein [Acidovorax sp. SRB_14]NMM87110.1 hypothetical protein [Rhodococcus sp. SRB_17]